jgi:hypothetical protein
VVKTKKEYLAWPGKRFGRPGADFSLYPVVNVGFVWMELKLGLGSRAELHAQQLKNRPARCRLQWYGNHGTQLALSLASLTLL